MCSPILAVMGITTALSAGGQVAGGMASAQGHKANAKQYEIQRIETRTAASAASRDRFEEFAELESANQLAAAASGFTTGSFKSLFEGNRERALEDASRIEADGRSKDARLKFAAKQERQAARGALVGGILGGLTTGLSGVMNIQGAMGSAPSRSANLRTTGSGSSLVSLSPHPGT